MARGLITRNINETTVHCRLFDTLSNQFFEDTFMVYGPNKTENEYKKLYKKAHEMQDNIIILDCKIKESTCKKYALSHENFVKAVKIFKNERN